MLRSRCEPPPRPPLPPPPAQISSALAAVKEGPAALEALQLLTQAGGPGAAQQKLMPMAL